MACYSAEHAYNETRSFFTSASCRIKDVIWVIRWPLDGPTEMRKFDLNTKQWQKVTFNNGHLVRFTVPFDGLDATYAWNGNIVFARNSDPDVTELFVFDTIKLEWTHLINLPRFVNPCLCIKENTMYTFDWSWYHGKSHFVKICLRTFEITSVQWNEFRTEHSVCQIELDGSLYIITLEVNGMRKVYQHDEQTGTFIRIHEKRENYIGVGSHSKTNQCWSSNNKLYQAIENTKERFLIIESFDIEAKQWKTIFKSSYFDKILGIYHKDNTIFVVGNMSIREIEEFPSLETLSLIRLNKRFMDVRNKQKMDQCPCLWKPVDESQLIKPIDWASSWPYVLRERFNHITGFMMQDEGEHALKQKDKRTAQEIYEQLCK